MLLHFFGFMFTLLFRSVRRIRFLLITVSVASLGSIGVYSADTLSGILPEDYLPELSRILNTAMTESDTMRIRELSEELSVGTRTRLAAPSRVKARGTFSYRAERELGGSDDNGERIFYNFLLTKSIYHWGEIRALRRKGEIANEIENLASFGAFRSLALGIRAAYLELIARDYEVRVAEGDLKLQDALLGRAEANFDRGELTADALSKVKDPRDRSALEVMKAKAAFEQQLLDTAYLAGVSAESIRPSAGKTIPKLEVLSDEAVERLTASVEGALKASSDLKHLERSVEDADQMVTIANAKLKPKVNFESGLTQFQLDERGVRQDEELLFAGVAITWNIWDGAESRGQAIEARSRVELARMQIDQAKRNLDADLKNARRGIEIAKLNLEIEEALLSQGELRLEKVRRELEAGDTSQQGLIGAERGMLIQELSTVRARAGYLNSVTYLASLLGLDPAALKYIASKED